ncbi:hypothetical protein [Aridibaculum aurantiacum]|nr:hypothetical protein [Aridibaculum aurantiacum]
MDNIDDKKTEAQETKNEKKQQQSDPQITELKGLTDPDEPLEVEGTDNPT